MSAPEILDRQVTSRGELVLRRCGQHYEIISNGVFLMDTRQGESERELVRAALHELRPPDQAGPVPAGTDLAGTYLAGPDLAGPDLADTDVASAGPASLLIGGLGAGFSLAEALAAPWVGRVTVVEIESAVLDWHRTHLADLSAGLLDDPRVEVANADLLAWLDAGSHRYDAVCVDIDNGPEWTVTESNAELYRGAGLAALVRRLRPGGILAVWSASAAPAFRAELERIFTRVLVRTVPVPRGEPDHVYLARHRAGHLTGR